MGRDGPSVSSVSGTRTEPVPPSLEAGGSVRHEVAVRVGGADGGVHPEVRGRDGRCLFVPLTTGPPSTGWWKGPECPTPPRSFPRRRGKELSARHPHGPPPTGLVPTTVTSGTTGCVTMPIGVDRDPGRPSGLSPGDTRSRSRLSHPVTGLSGVPGSLTTVPDAVTTTPTPDSPGLR